MPKVYIFSVSASHNTPPTHRRPWYPHPRPLRYTPFRFLARSRVRSTATAQHGRQANFASVHKVVSLHCGNPCAVLSVPCLCCVLAVVLCPAACRLVCWPCCGLLVGLSADAVWRTGEHRLAYVSSASLCLCLSCLVGLSGLCFHGCGVMLHRHFLRLRRGAFQGRLATHKL